MTDTLKLITILNKFAKDKNNTGRGSRALNYAEELGLIDKSTIRVPKESITQLREILSTLMHHTNSEGVKLIEEAF